MGKMKILFVAAIMILLPCLPQQTSLAREPHNSSYTQNIERDSHGHIKRSSSARRAFMRQTGYPYGRPGYVIDHIIPLKRGGRDVPINMQWQTRAAAKEKDLWE